jgi:uncharacterized protein
MVIRDLNKLLAKRIDYQKVIILFGPRQVGKTTLINQMLKALKLDYEYYSGDHIITKNLWTSENLNALIQSFGNKKVIVLDEAQHIESIGLICKQIIDTKAGLQLILTGSSSLDIANKTQEPLTGRKWEYNLLPISVGELMNFYGVPKLLENLRLHLVFGMYPEVLNKPQDAREVLANITSSYLYKDVLALVGIKKPMLLEKILKALAWQVGSEVSLNELASILGADVKTVDNYIYLLEQVFVVYRLGALSRNLRNEIVTKKKIFFYDNGIRNAVIGNFSMLSDRNDVGALWENFMIMERKKILAYNGFYGSTYFWRNKLQAEVDYIEEIDGKFYAFEFKWNPTDKVKFPKAFLEKYQPAETKVIHKDNYWQWLQNYPY